MPVANAYQLHTCMQCFRLVIPRNTSQIICIFSVYTQAFREVCIYMYQEKTSDKHDIPYEYHEIIIITLFKSQIYQLTTDTTNWVDYIISITIKSNQTLVFGEKENWGTWRKTSWSRVENQQTQPAYDVGSRNRTGTHWWKVSALTTTTIPAPLVEGERILPNCFIPRKAVA